MLIHRISLFLWSFLYDFFFFHFNLHLFIYALLSICFLLLNVLFIIDLWWSIDRLIVRIQILSISPIYSSIFIDLLKLWKTFLCHLPFYCFSQLSFKFSVHYIDNRSNTIVVFSLIDFDYKCVKYSNNDHYLFASNCNKYLPHIHQ